MNPYEDESRHADIRRWARRISIFILWSTLILATVIWVSPDPGSFISGLGGFIAFSVFVLGNMLSLLLNILNIGLSETPSRRLRYLTLAQIFLLLVAGASIAWMLL